MPRKKISQRINQGHARQTPNQHRIILRYSMKHSNPDQEAVQGLPETRRRQSPLKGELYLHRLQRVCRRFTSTDCCMRGVQPATRGDPHSAVPRIFGFNLLNDNRAKRTRLQSLTSAMNCGCPLSFVAPCSEHLQSWRRSLA